MRLSIRAFGFACVISAMAATGRGGELSSCAPGSTCDGLPASASPFAGDLCERPFLLGDLCGFRDELGADGIAINVRSLQYYQGVASGGIRSNSEYAGHDDYLVNVDGQKAGLWEGFFISLHGETRNGDLVDPATGAIIPVNTLALFPQPKGTITALTGVKFTQALSENFVTFAGKINTLDGFNQPFTGGPVDGFMNMGFAFPLVVARQIPYSTLGGGFAILEEKQPVFTAMFLDTNNTPTESGFDTFFDNGVTTMLNVNVPVTVAGLPGHQGLTGIYSTGTYNDLQPTAYFDPNVGLIITTGTDDGSWSAFYSADQALYVDPCNPKRSWGVFTNLGTADNGPSPIRFSGNVGVGGSSLVASRPIDTFGVAYTFTRYSSPVRELAPVLLPIGDDQAIELFYNYAVTPWFRLTPDLQVIFPARERTLPPNARDIDTALVLGLRAKVEF